MTDIFEISTDNIVLCIFLLSNPNLKSNNYNDV